MSKKYLFRDCHCIFYLILKHTTGITRHTHFQEIHTQHSLDLSPLATGIDRYPKELLQSFITHPIHSPIYPGYMEKTEKMSNGSQETIMQCPKQVDTVIKQLTIHSLFTILSNLCWWAVYLWHIFGWCNQTEEILKKDSYIFFWPRHLAVEKKPNGSVQLLWCLESPGCSWLLMAPSSTLDVAFLVTNMFVFLCSVWTFASKAMLQMHCRSSVYSNENQPTILLGLQCLMAWWSSEANCDILSPGPTLIPCREFSSCIHS